jgi:hypothetical protein
MDPAERIKQNVLDSWEWSRGILDSLYHRHRSQESIEDEFGIRGTGVSIEEYLENYDLSTLDNAARELKVPLEELQKELLDRVDW